MICAIRACENEHLPGAWLDGHAGCANVSLLFAAWQEHLAYGNAVLVEAKDASLAHNADVEVAVAVHAHGVGPWASEIIGHKASRGQCPCKACQHDKVQDVAGEFRDVECLSVRREGHAVGLGEMGNDRRYGLEVGACVEGAAKGLCGRPPEVREVEAAVLVKAQVVRAIAKGWRENGLKFSACKIKGKDAAFILAAFVGNDKEPSVPVEGKAAGRIAILHGVDFGELLVLGQAHDALACHIAKEQGAIPVKDCGLEYTVVGRNVKVELALLGDEIPLCWRYGQGTAHLVRVLKGRCRGKEGEMEGKGEDKAEKNAPCVLKSLFHMWYSALLPCMCTGICAASLFKDLLDWLCIRSENVKQGLNRGKCLQI